MNLFIKKWLPVIFFCAPLYLQGQTDVSNNEIAYSASLGAGTGKSPNFENGDWGIGGKIDFTAQKGKSMVTTGYRGTGEFQILGGSYPSRTMAALELLYGHELVDKRFTVSVHMGVAFVSNLERGRFLYADPGILSPSHYERIRFYTAGLPISSKILMPLTELLALGIEAYINVNNQNTFYGLNGCISFTNIKLKKKR